MQDVDLQIHTHQTHNRLVPRSNRGGATKYIKDLQQIVVGPFCFL